MRSISVKRAATLAVWLAGAPTQWPGVLFAGWPAATIAMAEVGGPSSGVSADVVAAFNQFDEDGSGDIDSRELRAALEAAGLILDDEQALYMMRKYDDDRGKSLDLEEFSSLVEDLRSQQLSETQQRFKLRTHPRVLEALGSWWDIAVNTGLARVPPPSDGSEGEPKRRMSHEGEPVLKKKGYVAILKKIMRAMSQDFDDAEAAEMAEEEWHNDRKGYNYLDVELFKDGLF